MIIDADKLHQRYVERIAGVRDKKIYIGPECVSLNITNFCNLRCKYCWPHAPGNPLHSQKARFFPWDRFVGIVNNCVDLNVDQIHLVGNGEPTQHSRFREMMCYLEGKPLKVILFTNATFPSARCCDVIKADQVIINLGAVDRQQYQELHGKDFFDRVLGNIERLVSLRDDKKPAFSIEIVYVVNSLNVGHKQAMRELASRLGVNFVHFKRMNVEGYTEGIALPEDCRSISAKKRTPPACLNGWFSFVVRLDGKVSTCCLVHAMPLGDFQKQSLKKIWFSPAMMKIRLLGKYGHIQKKYKVCKLCPDYDANKRHLLALTRNIHDH